MTACSKESNFESSFMGEPPQKCHKVDWEVSSTKVSGNVWKSSVNVRNPELFCDCLKWKWDCLTLHLSLRISARQVWFGVHPTLQSRTSCTIKVDYHASHSNFLIHSIKIEKIDAPHCIQVTHLLYFIRVMIDNAAAHSDTESRVLNQSFLLCPEIQTRMKTK